MKTKKELENNLIQLYIERVLTIVKVTGYFSLTSRIEAE